MLNFSRTAPLHSVALFFAMMLLFAQRSEAVTESLSDQDKVLYALGLIVANQLSPFSLSSAELEIVKQSITDELVGSKRKIEITAELNEKVQQLARSRRLQFAEKLKPAYQEYAQKAAAAKGAITLPTGVIYTPLVEGVGNSPRKTDTVKVNYRGLLVDGREFDSSFKRGKPSEFRLDGVIPCWTEAVQKMKSGGKAKLVCPSTTAYGEKSPAEMILPNAMLVFEIDLIEIVPKK